jgi:drug/metabolite transporter (DMT)-like permease
VFQNWNETLGYICILLASCFFGGSAILGKTIMQNGLSTIMLMQCRSVVTSLVLLVLLAIFGRKHLKVRSIDIFPLLLLGIPGLALVNASYYYAVQVLTVATAVFIQFTAPVIVFVYGLLTKREEATKSKVFALILSIAGTFLMVQLYRTQAQSLPPVGLLSAFVSAMSFAFYVIHSHELGKRHSAWTLIFYGYTIAGIFWCIVQNPADTYSRLQQNDLWSDTMLFTVFSTLIPFVLFLEGLRRVTATGGAIASTTETVMASLFAYLILGETMTAEQVIGASLILSAVSILILSGKRPIEAVPAD